MASSKPPADATTTPQHAAGSTHINGASVTQPPSTTTTSATNIDKPTMSEKSALDPALPITAEKEHVGASPRSSYQTDDDVNPPDFQGEVLSNDELPSPATIRRISDYIVLDRHGKTHTFKSLYTGRNVARRVLIIFVRHFFCGNCQEYLRSLSASITPESLLGLPISTFIAVIGCGDPALIDMYAAASDCPYPIYADPTRKLYQELGMVKTLALGERPAYMRKSLLKSSLDSIVQGVKQIKSGLAIKGGDQRQIGGEFLFEPVDICSPQGSPVQEFDRKLRLNNNNNNNDEAAGQGGGGVKSDAAAAATDRKHSRTTSTTDNDNDEIEEPHLVEEKKVTWCHRMRTTRDHAEIPELMEILGLNGQGQPIKNEKRWSKAVETRKGTGLSMAKRMSQMSGHNSKSEGT